MFVLVLNMLGMVPYSFTVTSHIIVTFALAAFIFLGVTADRLHQARGGSSWNSSSLRWRALVYAAAALVIEVISYCDPPAQSVPVRLFANMMAGHTMLKVFGAFVVALGILGGWAALGFMVAFTGLEILVAFLQAYVFAILTCIYLNDALHMHH